MDDSTIGGELNVRLIHRSRYLRSPFITSAVCQALETGPPRPSPLRTNLLLSPEKQWKTISSWLILELFHFPFLTSVIPQFTILLSTTLPHCPKITPFLEIENLKNILDYRRLFVPADNWVQGSLNLSTAHVTLNQTPAHESAHNTYKVNNNQIPINAERRGLNCRKLVFSSVLRSIQQGWLMDLSG